MHFKLYYNIPPTTAAAATTAAYDMEVETISEDDVLGFQSDTERLYTCIKGDKHRMLSQPVQSILDKLDFTPTSTTPIVNCARTIAKDQDIMYIDMSLDMHDPSSTITVTLEGDHALLGFLFHSDLRTPTIQDCAHDTPANSIERWRSRFRNATIRAINGEIVDTIQQFKDQIKRL